MQDRIIKPNLSEIIAELQNIEDTYGDMPVTVNILHEEWKGIQSICIYQPTDEPVLLIEIDEEERTSITDKLTIYES